MILSRRRFIQNISVLTGGLVIYPHINLFGNSMIRKIPSLSSSLFGDEFVWGAASSAFQSEGAWNEDGRSPSIWDTYSQKRGKIRNNDNARVATDFYHRYPEDLTLLQNLNFNAFRFSISWSRLLPEGQGKINVKGIDFYNRLIDTCLEKNITPWATLYHWDLPQVLENRGGWANRDILGWFEEYCNLCAKSFGDRVKNWIILNEPLAFTSFGYFLGSHAPGKRGLNNFMPAVHHAALCQSIGTDIVRNMVSKSQVGTTFSCSPVEPFNDKPKNIEAARRLDAVLNRLFIEPSLGLGYPVKDVPILRMLEKYYAPDDEKRLTCNFDFIGLQYYFRVVARHNIIPPLFAGEVKPEKRNVPLNSMKLEVYPEGIQQMLERFAAYKNVKKIYVTESGVCYNDTVNPDGSIADSLRVAYFKSTLEHILLAKNKGVPVEGYFVWSLTDNFEWKFGYSPRFGLVYVDYRTQQRILKDSGKWFRDFLGHTVIP